MGMAFTSNQICKGSEMSKPRSGPSDRANYFRLLTIMYRLELLERGKLYYRLLWKDL